MTGETRETERETERGELISSALSPSTRTCLESKLEGKICIHQSLSVSQYEYM